MDYLYGKLNSEIKYKEYKGLETDTAEVSVDNEYNTFSVDVKRVPNKLYLTTLNGNTYSYDGSSTASFDLRTQVTNEVTDGNILAVESGAVKLFVDGKVLDLTNQIQDANSAIAKLNEEKLDKVTNTSEKTRAYIVGTDGTQGTMEIDVSSSGGTLAQRTPDGRLKVETATEDSDAVNKKQVEDGFVAKVTPSDNLTYVYGRDGNGDKSIQATSGVTANTVAYRGTDGVIGVGTPTDETHATNKKYVDGSISNSKISAINLTKGITSVSYDAAKGVLMNGTSELTLEDGTKKDVTMDVTLPIVPDESTTHRSYISIDKVDGKEKVGIRLDDTAASIVEVAAGLGNNSVLGAHDGTPTEIYYGTDGSSNYLVQYDANGAIKAYVVEDEYDAVNKGYVDDGFVPIHNTGSAYTVYATTLSGENIIQTSLEFNQAPTNGSIVQRSASGVVRTGTPVGASDATTKKYVDDADAKKLDLTGGTITGSLAIQGDLTVTGTTTTEKAETLAVKDSVIITNADGAELGATLSGIAIRKDGENTYGVMYDPSSNSVKLGLGTLDAENKFTFNDSGTDGKPIATRDDSGNLTDGDLVRWDGTSKSLVDSGKKVDDFVEKVTEGGRNQAYTVDTNNQQAMMGIDEGVSAWSLVRRYADGRAKVGTAVEDNDAVNKKQVEDGFVAKQTYSGTDDLSFLYGYGKTGDKYFQITGGAAPNTVAYRGANGVLNVGTPTADANATTKKYVDDANSKKVNLIDGLTEGAVVYATETANGTTIGIPYSGNSADPDSIVRRTADGSIVVGTPVGDNSESAVNIEYANANYVAKGTANKACYNRSSTGAEGMVSYNEQLVEWTLVQRGANGVVRVGTPVIDQDAVPKKYADEHYAPLLTTNNPAYPYFYTVYGTNAPTLTGGSLTANPTTVAIRGEGGRLQVGTPVGVNDATPKAYVDDSISNSSITAINLTKEITSVSYDATNHIGINGISELTLTDGNKKDVTMNISIPIIGDEGIVLDKKSAEEKVEIKLDTSFTDGKYVAKGTTPKAVYTRDSQGNESMIAYTDNNTAWSIAQRYTDGRMKVGSPVADNDAATKSYVDGEISSAKHYIHTINITSTDYTGIISATITNKNIAEITMETLGNSLEIDCTYQASGYLSGEIVGETGSEEFSACIYGILNGTYQEYSGLIVLGTQPTTTVESSGEGTYTAKTVMTPTYFKLDEGNWTIQDHITYL